VTSTFSPNIGLEIPARGDYSAGGGDWDLPMNSDLSLIDTAFGGVLSLAVTGGTVALTIAQAANAIWSFSGTLSANQYIQVPAIGGTKTVIFGHVPAGFTLTIVGNLGADTIGIWTTVALPYPIPITITPTRVYWAGYNTVPPGTSIDWPVTSLIPPSFTVADGTNLSTTQYDLLFNSIGYQYGGSGALFTKPDYRGYATAGADNMGTSAGSAGRLNNWTVNTQGGQASHLLTVTEMPSHNHLDIGHYHNVNDPSHAHGGVPTPVVGAAYGGPNLAISGSGNTQYASTGISLQQGFANLAQTGGSGAHNNVQPTRTVLKLIRF
jgi:microcystin-dependent protein